MMSDPMKFFVSRVKSNLHIVLILPPEHDLLKIALSSYPGIVSECQVRMSGIKRFLHNVAPL